MCHTISRDPRRRSTNATALAVCVLLTSCEVVFGGAEPDKNIYVYVNESAQHNECQNRRDAGTPELAIIRAVVSTLISSAPSPLSAGGRTGTHFESCFNAVSDYLLVHSSSLISDDQFLSLLLAQYLRVERDRQRHRFEDVRTEVRGAGGFCTACTENNCMCVCFVNTSACSMTESRRLNNSALNFPNTTVLPGGGWNSSAKLQGLLQEADTAFSTLQKPLPSAADTHRALLAARTLAELLESFQSSRTLIPCTRSNASRCINVGRLRTAIVAVTMDKMRLNSSFLLEQLKTLNAIRSASRTFSTASPFFWPEDDWKSFQRNISTALCNALFPTCLSGLALPLSTCYETCGALRKFENLLNWPLLKGTPFSLANSALIPTLARSSCPRDVLQGEPCVFASPSPHCSSCSARRIVSAQTSNVSRAKTDPLQIPCTAPLQKTSVREHYIPAIRDHIRSAAAKIFNSTLNWTNDDIDGFFPCGIGCSTAGYSPNAASNVKAVQITVSWLVLLASAAACFFYVRNRSKEKETAHRRLILCFNINYLVLAISFLPTSFDWKSLYCHGDGTLRLGERSSDRDFMCSLLGTLTYASMLMNSFLLVCLSHLWLVVVRQLKKATVARKDRGEQRKIFFIYLTVSLIPTVAFTIVPLALQQITGSPILGTCGVRNTHLFPLLTVPVSIAILIAVVFLIAGLRLLFPAWKKATIVGRRLRARSCSLIESPQTARRLSAQSRKQPLLEQVRRKFSSLKNTGKSSEALRLLILQLFIFVAASMTMAAANLAFGIIVYKDKDDWEKGLYESITCQIVTASKLRHTCRDIPIISADVIIMLMVSFGAACIPLLSWVAFREKSGLREGSAKPSSDPSSNNSYSDFKQPSSSVQASLIRLSTR